jgi:hypothetical protein
VRQNASIKNNVRFGAPDLLIIFGMYHFEFFYHGGKPTISVSTAIAMSHLSTTNGGDCKPFWNEVTEENCGCLQKWRAVRVDLFIGPFGPIASGILLYR